MDINHIVTDSWDIAYFHENGIGEKVVVLPGYATVLPMLEDMLTGLVIKGYDVYAPYLHPNHGDSVIPADFSDYEKKLRSFVSKIGLDSYHLVGWSMGAGIAYLHASENPNVKTLTSLGGILPTPDRPAMLRNLEAFASLLEGTMVSHRWILPYLAEVARLSSFPENSVTQEEITGYSFDGVGIVDQPTRFIYGSKDRYYPRKIIEDFFQNQGRQIFPNRRKLMLVKGWGHNIVHHPRVTCWIDYHINNPMPTS